MRASSTRGRVVNPEVRTIYHRTVAMVEARYATRRVYRHPDDFPSYARPRFSSGTWYGDIEISEFEETEAGALTSLRETLHVIGLDGPASALVVAIASLREERRGHDDRA